MQSEQELSESLQRKLTLYSTLPLQALISQFDAGFIATPSDKEALIQSWNTANQAYRELGPPSRSFLMPDDMFPIDNDEFNDRILKIKAKAKLYPPYDTHSTEVMNLRIGKLVTPQISIGIKRASQRSRIEAVAKNKVGFGQLLDISFNSPTKTKKITRQILGLSANGGSIQFSSYDEDIRLHHPPQYHNIPLMSKDPNSAQYDNVCFPVGGGLHFAACYKINVTPEVSRLVIANGIHRAYSLAKNGHEWMPCLVTELSPMELPEQFVDLPKEFLLRSDSNPPVITDFLNDSLTISLDYHKVLKTVRLNWNFEQNVIVLG